MLNTDIQLQAEILKRMKAAKEWTFARGYSPHPAFKRADLAAHRLLTARSSAQTLMVMRDASLRPVREVILDSGLKLVIPDSWGLDTWSIPPQAMVVRKAGAHPSLRINPLPSCARPYVGNVDAVIVGCLAFDPATTQLYGFDTERTAGIIDSLYDGTDRGFRLGRDVPVIAVAADSQQVSNWPDIAQSYVCADLVVTPTRTIALGQTDVRIEEIPNGES